MRLPFCRGSASYARCQDDDEENLVHLASSDGEWALLQRVFQDNSERFLRSLRDRVDRVSTELPVIEVRYQDLSIKSLALRSQIITRDCCSQITNSRLHFCNNLSRNLVLVLGDALLDAVDRVICRVLEINQRLPFLIPLRV
jgi:hypothetical protein